MSGLDATSQLEISWKNLVTECPNATPFQTFEWQSLWFSHFGFRKRPITFVMYDGNDLVGLFPLVKTIGAVRILRSAGCGPSDYLAPLIRPGYEERFWSLFFDQINENKKFDLVDIQQLRNSPSLADPRARVLPQATCLVLELPKSFDDYLEMIGKSLRQDVKKLEKRAFSEGIAKIHPLTEKNVDEGMDILFDCHLRRWKARGLPGAFIGKKTHRFHKEWASVAVQKNWLRVSLLEVSGVYAGAIYAMQMHGICYFYQSGFDPIHKAISPGTLLVASTIKSAIEEGCHHFDFMRGDEPYKRRWKPQQSFENHRILIPLTKSRGRLAESVQSAMFRVESKIRTRFEGRGLK